MIALMPLGVHPFAQPEHLAANVRRVAAGSRAARSRPSKTTRARRSAFAFAVRIASSPTQIELAALLDRLRQLRVEDVDALSRPHSSPHAKPAQLFARSARRSPRTRRRSPARPRARAARQHLHAEDRLAGAGAAEHDGDSTTGQARRPRSRRSRGCAWACVEARYRTRPRPSIPLITWDDPRNRFPGEIPARKSATKSALLDSR